MFLRTLYRKTPGMTLPEELVALLAEEAPKKKVRSKKTKKAAVTTGTEDAWTPVLKEERRGEERI